MASLPLPNLLDGLRYRGPQLVPSSPASDQAPPLASNIVLPPVQSGPSFPALKSPPIGNTDDQAPTPMAARMLGAMRLMQENAGKYALAHPDVIPLQNPSAVAPLATRFQMPSPSSGPSLPSLASPYQSPQLMGANGPVPTLANPFSDPTGDIPGSTARHNLLTQQAAINSTPVMPSAGPMIPAPIGSTQGDENELARVQRSGSGLTQLTHPVDANGNPTGEQVGLGRKIGAGLLRGLDVAGQVFLPNLERAIPGTEGHHQLVAAQDQGKVQYDQAQTAADTANSNAALVPQQKQDAVVVDLFEIPHTLGVDRRWVRMYQSRADALWDAERLELLPPGTVASLRAFPAGQPIPALEAFVRDPKDTLRGFLFAPALREQ